MTDSTSEASGRIFISYRRQDSAYPAGWLYDRLVERFGAEQIFKDVDSIELGDDFVDTITNAVGSCDVVLALIGKKWATIKSGRDRRLDDPNDFVRLEIEAALERDVLLIPILVDGALMPRAGDLPDSIAPLVRRQALELSPLRFRSDTDALLTVLGRTLTDIQGGSEPAEVEAPPQEPAAPAAVEAEVEATSEPSPTTLGSRRRIWMAAAAGAAVLAVVLAVVLNLGPDDAKEAGTTADPATPTATATPPPQLGGAGAPVVLAHRGGDEEFAWQTIPAFEHAAGLGAAIETDVRWTKDGVAVLVHDAGTQPGMECDGGNYIVAEENWPVLRDNCRSAATASKDGKQYPIPTLADALSAIAKIPGAEVYAEIKVKQTARQVRQFVGFITNVRMTERAVVTSALPAQLKKILAQAREDGVDLRTMQFVSGQPVPVGNLVEGISGVAVKADIADAAYVSQLKAADLRVMVWNINTPEQWAAAVDAGADEIMTDKPVAFGDWFEQR